MRSRGGNTANYYQSMSETHKLAGRGPVAAADFGGQRPPLQADFGGHPLSPSYGREARPPLQKTSVLDLDPLVAGAGIGHGLHYAHVTNAVFEIGMWANPAL